MEKNNVKYTLVLLLTFSINSFFLFSCKKRIYINKRQSFVEIKENIGANIDSIEITEYIDDEDTSQTIRSMIKNIEYVDDIDKSHITNRMIERIRHDSLSNTYQIFDNRIALTCNKFRLHSSQYNILITDIETDTSKMNDYYIVKLKSYKINGIEKVDSIFRYD